MAIADLTDFIVQIKALNKTNKRLFFTALSNEQADAFALTAEEIAQNEADELTSLRTQAGTMFGVTVPANVTVNQIKTYLNKWVDDRAVKITAFCDVTKFKLIQVSEAEANGNDVKAWLKQAVKVYWNYKSIQ